MIILMYKWRKKTRFLTAWVLSMLVVRAGPGCSEVVVCAFLACRNTSFIEFSLCLSRACLGKITIFKFKKWRKERSHHPVCRPDSPPPLRRGRRRRTQPWRTDVARERSPCRSSCCCCCCCGRRRRRVVAGPGLLKLRQEFLHLLPAKNASLVSKFPLLVCPEPVLVKYNQF
jgi:hypothetical protein